MRPWSMPKRSSIAIPCLLVLCLLAAGCKTPDNASIGESDQIILTPHDRILVLAPHPDDEVLGCGGVIQRAVQLKLPVRVVVFTYGDNNQWSFLLYRKHPVLLPQGVRRMGLVRHDEAVAAAEALGLSSHDVIFLGYPDVGTMQIWKAHWGDSLPFRSMLTKATAVPYDNALRPGAPYKGEDVLRDLSTVMREFRPTKVFVSHPADHMPDHAALYLFTQVALWDLQAQGIRPKLYPYLVHFPHWPKPRGYQPQQLLTPPRALQDTVPWRSWELTSEEIERKHRAIQAHRTQYAYSAKYLLSFIRSNELFGDFPLVMLRPTDPAIPLASDHAEHVPLVREELTEQEAAAFVGIEERFVRLEGDTVVLSLKFSRPLAEAVEASLFVFGYRPDRPFAEMPKVHIKLGEFSQVVYDQERVLPKGAVQIVRQPTALVVRVPLSLLGSPERLFTSARTYLGDVPLDWVSWRVLELPNHLGKRSVDGQDRRGYTPAKALKSMDASRV